MSIDMSREWIKASNDDLKVINEIIHMEDLSHVTAFHAQQSIEKSFKSLMEHHNIKVPKQHDLLKLKFLIAHIIAVENEDLLDTLNELYIESRYPGDMGLLPEGKPTLVDANEFYTFAKDVFSQACKLLEINMEEVQ